MRFAVVLAILVSPFVLFAQSNDPAVPPLLVPAPSYVDTAARIAEFAPPEPMAELPEAKVHARGKLEEMAEHNRRKIGAPRDGFERPLPSVPVDVPRSRSGKDVEHTAPNGDVIWSARVRVKDAHDLRLHLEGVSLPEGTRMWVYAPGRPSVEFGPELVSATGDLYTPTVDGEVAFLEVRVPKGAVARFRLTGVVEGFALDEEGQPLLDGEPDPMAECFIDANCVGTGSFSAITQGRGAAAHLRFISSGGNSSYCTGSLLNDSASSFQPYILTANHCLSTQSSASTIEAYWDFRTSSCNAGEPGYWQFSRTLGATLLSTSSNSDFTFLRLSGSVPLTNRWYLGWNANAVAANTLIHRVSHPSARPQKYSSTTVLTSGGITCTGLPRPQFLYSTGTSGSTAGGSSGAPVMLNNGQVVGQLYGTCHFQTWDNCTYSTYNTVDGAFSSTFPSISGWLQPSVSLQSYSLSRSTIPAGETFTITESISTSAPMTIMLGASIVRSGTSTFLSDPANDIEVTTGSGTSSRTRTFRVPAGTASGTYDLVLSLVSDTDGDNAITANDRTYDYDQFAGVITVGGTCTYTIPPGGLTFTAAGGNGGFSVSTSAGCSWSAVSQANWITITSGSGTGNGSVSYSVAANSGGSRTGTIVLGGQTYTVTQDGCTYSINPSSISIGPASGSGSITVTASSGCPWSASSQANWITITGGASGNGNGTTFYSVTANTSTQSRQGTIFIAGYSFTVTQGGASCTYSISPTSASVGSGAGSGSFSVTAGAGCSWSAVSQAAWITITGGASGTGNGTVSYSYAANSGGARSGTIAAAGSTYTVNQAAAVVVPTVRLGDHNLDGRSDVFWWHNQTQDTAVWLMNGTVKSVGALVENGGSAWRPQGVGDFDGDGRADVFWRASSGENAVWLMNGTTKAVGAWTESAPPQWTVAGIGDFNADGRSDILWRTSNGDNAIWLMNGTVKSVGAVIEPAGPEWTVGGVGDLNADGRADIFWRNYSNGTNAIWLMNGTTKAVGAYAESSPVGWHVTFLRDFNADGRADVLWRHVDGNNAIWFMNGTVKTVGSYLEPAGTNWLLVAANDYDGDGDADIFWRDAGSGANAMWLMNGATKALGAVIEPAPVGWTVVP
jgi:FG-GAP-like repeat/Trypsin-like peptidase domain/Viral BACON domain